MKQKEAVKNALKAISEPRLRIAYHVDQLPEHLRLEIRDLLIEGASLEGATEAVNERKEWGVTPEGENQPAQEPAETHGDAPARLTPEGESQPAPEPAEAHGDAPAQPTAEGATQLAKVPQAWAVTLNAVTHYYQSDVGLQIARAKRRVETAETLTSSLAREGNPESPETRLLNALVMAGLQKVNEKDFSFAANILMRRRAETEHIRLKNLVMEAKEQSIRMGKAYLRAQTEVAHERKKFIHQQTANLRDLVQKLGKKRKITAETFQKIQEVYGILANNVAQSDPPIGVKEYEILAQAQEPVDPEILTQEYVTAPVDRRAAADQRHRENLRRLEAAQQEAAAKNGGNQKLLPPGEDEQGLGTRG